jgi:hypothetical protein
MIRLSGTGSRRTRRMRHAPSSTSGDANDRRHPDRPREARDDLRSHSLPLGGSDPHHVMGCEAYWDQIVTIAQLRRH